MGKIKAPGKLKALVFSESWKTSLGGVGAIFTGLGTIGAMIKTGNYSDWNSWGIALTSISGGIGLIFAKDKNVTGYPPKDVAH